uniref:Uncharacterized protein n=1 Tax=Guillardia theta TaxID=55529 RepID=A0A7S4PGJ9_GUITH
MERRLKEEQKEMLISALLRHPLTNVRIRMLNVVPKVVEKGDARVFNMVHERIFDWNSEVVRAAIACLRHAPSTLNVTLHQVKDLERQSDMEGGMIRCVFNILHDRASSSYESRSMSFERRQRWSSLTFRLDVFDTERAELEVILLGRRQGIVIGHESEFAVGKCYVKVTDLMVGNALEWFTLRNETLAPVGSVQLRTEVEQSSGIGDMQLASKVLPNIEGLLQSKDESVRIEAFKLMTDYSDDGNVIVAQKLLKGLDEKSHAIKWTCCECLRKILAGGKQGCVKMTLDHVVRMVQNDPDPDSRLVAMTVIGYAGRTMKNWMSTENGYSLRDVLEERLEDVDDLVRRSAITNYAAFCDKEDNDALLEILPFLSDEAHNVRIAAFRAIEQLFGGQINQQGPSDFQIELMKAIVDRGSQNQDLGIKISLLFQLGCMEGSGWNKPEHARWGHVKEWVTEQWQAMMQRREEDRLRRIYEKKMLSNRFFLRAMEDLRQEGKQDEETFKYGGSLNEEQTHALEVARVLASSKIQGVFRGVKLRKGISKLKADLLRQKQERMKARELERQKMKDDSKTFYSKLKVCKLTSFPC